ncbi:MAG TPA: DUF6249 domain-containing protein [Steroidobacteraceae bacterium]|nr:DUF6249 domain-containing protein [Steroidobacteraceae bacterium]
MTTNQFITPDLLSLMIPIVAIVMGIGLAMLSIYVDFLRKREILNAVHRERMAAIEKGMELPPLPPEIFQSRDRAGRRNRERTRERGLILTFVGIAIGVALWWTGNKHNAAWWGLVPLGLGLAYLISSRLRTAELAPPASGPSDQDFR